MNSNQISKSEILFLIVDITPSWWGANSSKNFDLLSFIDSFLAFANAHLIMNPSNEVIIYSVLANQSDLLWPVAEKNLLDEQNCHFDGQYESFALLNRSVKNSIREIIENTDNSKIAATFSGAIIKSLCYYLRRCRELQPNTISNLFDSESSHNLQGIEMVHQLTSNIKSRILVLKATSDCPTQYLSLMNAVFTAQKLEVSIDCCILPEVVLAESDVRSSSSFKSNQSTLFQQAADLTGGIYVQIPHPSALLQYLICIFLPSKKLRRYFVLPQASQRSGVDFRSACFCHRKLVDIAYVCSVCLSVLCEFTPICITCQTPFNVPCLTSEQQ